MDITVNKTEFEDLKNATDVDMSTLSLVSHFLYLYAYLIIGPVLVLVNAPAFLLVMMRETLRFPYMILAVVFLNNALSGMSAISVGLKRLIISTVEEQKIAHYDCIFSVCFFSKIFQHFWIQQGILNQNDGEKIHVPVFLLTTFSLNGWSLLMNSVERLCVVAYPIYYYTHSKRIICSLIIAQYTITIIVVTSTILASLVEPIRYVSNFCMLQKVYSAYFYVSLILMNSISSLLSIVLMVIVVIMLKKKFNAHFQSNDSCNRDLKQFLRNQKRYTHTALISCCFTFFLVVVPSILQCIYVMDPATKSQIIVMSCVYLPLLNSFNMVILFLYRQKDLQRAAVLGIKWLFCKKKHIEPVTNAGFG
ncbi:Mitochondrial group I intron splicing factor [Dirofilaria immitis]